MPVYNHNGHIGPPANISSFVSAARTAVAPGGLQPFLGGEASTNLGVNAAALQNIGQVAQVTRANGLLTCAAVIYVSTHPLAVAGAWVHHANAGRVRIPDVNAAITALGNPPPATVLVIFAHPGPSDSGYADSIATIIGQGVFANNLVEIPNLIAGQFGINNLGWIG